MADQPVSLIHGEINTFNSLQTPDGGIYLLDWDAVGTGPTVLGAGYPLITCFLDENLTFHRDRAAAFYDGYTAGQGMTGKEKETLFTAALLHALRYLRFGDTARRWTRVCYAVEQRERLLDAIATRQA